MKRLALVVCMLVGLLSALAACGQPATPPVVQATIPNVKVVATFYGPTYNDSLAGRDMEHRFLKLVFANPGTYSEHFALGPSEDKADADGDKKYIPADTTFTSSEKANEQDIYLHDWPTYFTVTINAPDGTSGTVELYSN